MAVPIIRLNAEEADEHFRYMRAQQARDRLFSSASQVSCIFRHRVNANMNTFSDNTIATGSGPSLSSSTPTEDDDPLDDEEYYRLHERHVSRYNAALADSFAPESAELVARIFSKREKDRMQATAASSLSPTLTVPTSTSYSTGSSTTRDPLSPLHHELIKSHLKALEPMFLDLLQKPIEDARHEENVTVGSTEYRPILLLLSVIFLFGFSIGAIRRAAHRWGLQLLAWIRR